MRTKTTILLLGLMIFSFATSAQISIGVHTNLIFNDTEISSGVIDLDNTVKSMQGYSIGGIVAYDLNDKWAVNSGLSYKHIGFQVIESTSFGVFGFDIPLGATLTTTVNYLEAPMLFRYKYNLGNISAFVEAGPSINYALDGKVETTANSLLDIDVNETSLNLAGQSINRINTAGNIGAGISYPFTQDITLSAGIRYSRDLSTSVELPIVNAAVKNNSVSLGVSVAQKF